jgi:hypothetical protein
MAKFTVTYKSPHVYDSISEAKSDVPAGGVERLCDKFGIGEYLTLELDTEAETCVILPEKVRMESAEYYAGLTTEWNAKREAEAAEIAAWDAAMETGEIESKPWSLDGGFHICKASTPGASGDFEGESIQRIAIRT